LPRRPAELLFERVARELQLIRSDQELDVTTRDQRSPSFVFFPGATRVGPALGAILALLAGAALAPACGGDDGAGGGNQTSSTGEGGGQTGNCGDGFVDGDEECDDGNLDDSDNCLGTCVIARCGDLVVNVGIEECDDGNLDDSDDCLTACIGASCGDGFVWTGNEDCDDGNGEDGDACSSTCVAGSGCGNGVVEAGEACDDGNQKNSDACLNTCVDASCGDGYAQLGVEECDDGNFDDSDNCTNACTIGENANFGCPGTPVSIDANLEVSLGGDTSDATDAYDGSCGGFGSPEIVYAVTPQATGVLTIAMGGLVPESDPVLYVRSGTCEGSVEVAGGCADSTFGGGTETLVIQVTSGNTYYVFADGYDGTSGQFSLNLALSTQVPGDDCPGYPVAIAMNETKVENGNTAAAQPDRKGPGACASASTKEIVYAVTPSATGKLAVAMDPSYDASLYARKGSCTSTLDPAICLPDMTPCCSETAGPGGPEAIIFPVTAGNKYWIFADGKNGSSGNYSIEFNLLPP
jgi:cysteine-rich repeat protein